MTLCALSLCVLQLISSWASGTTIYDYANVSGTNVNYTYISEEPTRSTLPGPAGPLPKFGQPIGGDSLLFPLQTFYTKSVGLASDTCDSNLKMTISSTGNSLGIDKVTLNESGDYELLRLISTSDDPLAKVTAHGHLTVMKVNGQTEINGNSVIFDIYRNFDQEFHLSGSDVITPDWDGLLNFDVDQALQEQSYYQPGFHVTEAVFSLDNILNSMSEANSQSKIIKKTAYLTTTTIEVPEPSTLVMLFMGVLGLGIWWRKR